MGAVLPVKMPRLKPLVCLNDSRFRKSAAVAFLLFMMSMGATAARADGTGHKPARGMFVLAHTPVSEIDGNKEFIPKKGGGYDFLQYTPAKIGDAITFSVAIEQSGARRMQVTTYKDGLEGIYSIEVNGQEVSRKDFNESNVWEVGTFPVKPGVFQISFRCVGQSPKSGGMGLKLGTLHFRSPTL
jgi:hypothetical protein